MVESYIGESLIYGHIGRFLIVLILGSAIFSAWAYIRAVKYRTQPDLNQVWRKWGRIGFFIHAGAVLGTVGLLFYLILSNHSEYYYVWRHSEPSLPVKYIISSMWEGQEGSFLLWAFWHVIIGGVIIFIYRKKKWEAPVLTVIGITQAIIATMILGVYLFGFKIGNNPFILLRDAQPQHPINIFADYATRFDVQGNGLNALLKNYWMVIHPPTLFLGFASTVVPFAFVIGGLWTKEFKSWAKPALPWTLFATVTLGTGIIMGAAWAYEALSFGGFWAWDPVENASLVPWLLVVAGLHTLLVFRTTGHALVITLILLVSTFLTVLYSTFLTRSGVLGDSSVHSFTDDGLKLQLIFFMLMFIAWSVVLLIRNWKKLPRKEKEESSYSREFWMFIGALILLISAVHISFSTSLPVFNNILNWFGGLFGMKEEFSFTLPDKEIAYYNKVQIWIAILVAVLSGLIQYARYKGGNLNRFLKKIMIPAGIALVLTISLVAGFGFNNAGYVLLMFAAMFSLVANSWYIISIIKGKVKVAGASVAHIGFALMLIGVLVSASKKNPISMNNEGIMFGEGFDSEEVKTNIYLPKDSGKVMGDYLVTYVSDSTVEDGAQNTRTFFKVRYDRMNGEGEIVETFYLRPYVQEDANMGAITNPDTRHYLFKDIYTYVSQASNFVEQDSDVEAKINQYQVREGDTMIIAETKVVLKGIRRFEENGTPGAEALLEFQSGDSTISLMPALMIETEEFIPMPAQSRELNANISFFIKPDDPKPFIFIVQEFHEAEAWIVMKALVFPYINILWLGAIVMVIGMIMSLVQRARQNLRIDKRGQA